MTIAWPHHGQLKPFMPKPRLGLLACFAQLYSPNLKLTWTNLIFRSNKSQSTWITGSNSKEFWPLTGIRPNQPLQNSLYRGCLSFTYWPWRWDLLPHFSASIIFVSVNDMGRNGDGRKGQYQFSYNLVGSCSPGPQQFPKKEKIIFERSEQFWSWIAVPQKYIKSESCYVVLYFCIFPKIMRHDLRYETSNFRFLSCAPPSPEQWCSR